MESEISTLFTTIINKVHTTIENLLVEQERHEEVITKLIKDNNDKSTTIRQLQAKYEKKPEILVSDAEKSIPLVSKKL